MDAYLQIDMISVPKKKVLTNTVCFLFGLGAFLHGNTSCRSCVLNLFGGLTVGNLLRLFLDNLGEVVLKRMQAVQ